MIDMKPSTPSRRIGLVAAVGLLVAAGAGAAEPVVDLSGLEDAVSKLEALPEMTSARLGLTVLRLGTGEGEVEVVYEKDGVRSFVPASTTKVLTSVAALETLGPDYEFVTRFGYLGVLDAEGRLEGDLVIQGGGDPALAEDGWDGLFKRWAQALEALGLTQVSGGVVADASFFSGPPRSGDWNWRDLGNYYASGAGGLNFYGNRYSIRFRPGAVGAPAKLLGTYPNLLGVEFFNEMRTGAADSGDQGYVYAAPFAQVVTLRGTVPAGGPFSIKGALPNPALVCAQLLQKKLESGGMKFGKPATTVRSGGKGPSKGPAEWLAEERSPVLRNLMRRMNHDSVNLYAEALLKGAGRAHGGDGSVEGGVSALREWFKQNGILQRGWVMRDGAGLARANLISPRQLAEVLKCAHESPHGELLRESLPAAGRSGTLKRVARGTPAVGRLRAKSGTLAGVKCYAGYVRGVSGRDHAFALMVNHHAGTYSAVRSALEGVLVSLAGL